MSKSFNQAISITDKLYTYLDNRDWRIPNEPFKDTQRKINELQRESVDGEIERLKRYYREACSVADDELTDSYGDKVKVTAKERQKARVEMEKIQKAINDLRACWLELVGEMK